ncbi:sensor histidine kinase [Pararobbsia alpina]|uniref:sensor histidine kinase n=1 Tax=Pararobbsia alpina TaxID=621374 RepID=UPI0039A571E5
MLSPTQRVPLIGKPNPTLTLTLAGVLALVVFVIDTFGHLATAIMVLYVIVVMLAATVLSRRGTLAVAAGCIVLTIIAYVFGHTEGPSYSAIGRCVLACVAIATTTYLTLRLQANTVRLEAQVHELDAAHEALHRSMTELAHATRVTMLGELAASIAHEVSQPIAAIVTNGDATLRWLRRDTPEIGEACEIVEAMIRDARRASDIIRRIRALAQKREPAFVPIDINAVVSEAMDLVNREVHQYGAHVDLELAHGPLIVRGDRVQLQQVVINLLINGLQAMTSIKDRPRVLAVRTYTDDRGRVIIAVQDSGVGVTPENAAKLFHAFYTTKADGMGMGLSICRSIVEAHDGMIDCVASAQPGARMEITLPLLSETLITP